MPSPNDTFFTQRRSTGRQSSRLRRASRRLAKKGFRGEAGKLAAAAEMAKLQEPTIMRPEFRELDQAARDIQALQSQATAGGLDFDRDIAPLRGQFFGALGSSGLSGDEQQMLLDKYASGFASEGLAAEELQAKRAQRDMQAKAAEQAYQTASEKLTKFRSDIGRDREVGDMLGGLSTRIGDIMAAPDSREVKMQKLGTLSREPGVAGMMDMPRIASIFGGARAELTGEREYEYKTKSADRSFGLQAGQVLASMDGEAQAKQIDTWGLGAEGANIAKAAASHFAADRRISVSKAEREHLLQKYKLRMSRIATARDEIAALEKHFVVGGDVLTTGMFGTTTKLSPASIASSLQSLLGRFVPVDAEGRYDIGDDTMRKIRKITLIADNKDEEGNQKVWKWAAEGAMDETLIALQDVTAVVKGAINRETTLLSSIVEGSTGTATAAPTRNPAFSLGE